MDAGARGSGRHFQTLGGGTREGGGRKDRERGGGRGGSIGYEEDGISNTRRGESCPFSRSGDRGFSFHRVVDHAKSEERSHRRPHSQTWLEAAASVRALIGREEDLRC